MLTYVFVQLKRLLVLLLIIGLAWFTVFEFFPAVDSKLPFLVAVLITYGFLAYLAIPALLRVRHVIQPPTHVPTRTIAPDGWAVDPINIAILAKNEKEFIWAMRKAGWVQADPATFRNSLRMIYAIIFNRPYPTAPFGSYYVFGRKQDLGFQIQIGNSPRHRHHIRFWRVGTTLLDEEHAHHTFWRRLLKSFISKEKEIWVGAAIFDHGLSLRARNFQLDHGVESDTAAERDYVVRTLRQAYVAKDVIGIKAGEPLHTRHQGLGETIIADGYIKLCELKRQFLPPAPPD
jgi:hypothetical protein